VGLTCFNNVREDITDVKNVTEMVENITGILFIYVALVV
jgi:hypothetical protein